MTIEELRRKKREMGYTSEMIARKSGVPLSTVQKIFSGATKSPRRLTLEAIAAVLQEASWNYNNVRKDERHTLEDYYALPDDLRVELIDGQFFVMDAPSLEHQGLLVQLTIQFYECIEKHGMEQCAVYVAPCDVHLDMDNYTMVQPDLMVICGEHDHLAKRYEGAPDLVVEILSSSTRSKDMVLKLYKYHHAGVREYWTVDPKYQTVTVHFFEEDEYNPAKYTFEDTIPVRISEGTCSIDFSAIKKKLYH